MIFEEAMKHVQDGTATSDEREFVKSQLRLADAALGAQSAFNFDEAVKHVKNGTATEEEKRYVKKRLLEASDALSGRPKLNFEEALAHVQNGTATDEEKEFVKREVEEIDSLIDDGTRGKDMPIAAASREQIKRAKKSFKWRYIFVPICSIVAVVLAIGAILGGVFGFAASSATKQMKFDKNACIKAAKDFAIENQHEIFNVDADTFNASNLTIEEVDRHFYYNDRNIGDSYYIYEIEMEASTLLSDSFHPKKIEIEIKCEVDTRTGAVKLRAYEID